MAEETLENRLSAVESRVREQVTIRDLEAVQAALGAQILQLGTEMRAGFSTLRDEIRAGDEETRRVLRGEIRAGDEETRRVLRGEIRAGDEETRRVLRGEIRAGDEETRRVLRGEIRAGDEETRRSVTDDLHAFVEQRTQEILALVAAGDGETRRYMRVLYEDLVDRIEKTRG
jgi:hypothetical protein